MHDARPWEPWLQEESWECARQGRRKETANEAQQAVQSMLGTRREGMDFAG